MTDYYSRQVEDRQKYVGRTKSHHMTILQDDGVYRHIRMANPKNSSYAFNVTTIPGYLIFTGDTGSYVFSRLYDMFEFHRIKWDWETPSIDYRYWSEKCEASAKHGGTKEFDEDAFKQAAIREFWNHDWPDHKTRRYEWTLYIRDIISANHQSGDESIRAMIDYSYHRYSVSEWGNSKSEDVNPFHDFYEYGRFEKPSFRLKWACWAIAHTIRDYDRGGDKITRQNAADKLVLKVVA